VGEQDRRRRARAAIGQLARGGHDTVRFWQEATEVLRSVVPFDFEPCWFTLDPENLLITGHYNAGLRETPPEIVRGQYVENDVNTFVDLARGSGPATTVAAATRGQPTASWRWRHLLVPTGFDDALDAVLRVHGTAWGALSLLHAPAKPPFTRADVAFISQIAPALAMGTRLGLLRTRGETSARERPLAVLLLDVDMGVVSETAAAGEWLADLADVGGHHGASLPASVQATASCARWGAGGEATARVRARSGTWAKIHAARLAGPSALHVAVVLEPADEALIRPLLMYAHDLTDREREVVDLVVRGRSTEQIATSLFISPYTVQDRLKAVFEKVGVRSRRELVALVHARDFQPLIDANDVQVRAGRPILTAARTAG
jgi:DNA-binding CsgD family transcriptional regulator